MYQMHDRNVRTGAAAPPRESSVIPGLASEARVLVLLPEGPQALTLVRWAERLARVSSGTFCCVRLASGANGDSRSSLHTRAALRLADELGGRSVELRADALFEELFRFTAQQRITHIVLGKPRGIPLAAFLASTLPRQFTEGVDGPRIVVVTEPTRPSQLTRANS